VSESLNYICSRATGMKWPSYKPSIAVTFQGCSSSFSKAHTVLQTRSPHQSISMLFMTFTALALAATGLAQVSVPEGYRKVYVTSKQDTKYVIVPKTRAKESTLVV
jgi:hypothetical protein